MPYGEKFENVNAFMRNYTNIITTKYNLKIKTEFSV